MTRFEVLGGLQVLQDERNCTPTPPKVRQVLALLLLQANQVVTTEAIIDELWESEPPPSAVTTAQTYIYQLRKIIEREGLAGPEGELLVTKAPGYLLRIDPEQLDENVFTRLTTQGREYLEQRRFQEAATSLRQALSMWTGSPLSNVFRGRVLDAHVVHLEERMIRATEMRIEAEFQLGMHRELIGDLRVLVAQHPLNEWFHGRLIEALGRSGRRSEALMAYQTLRKILDDELGLNPSADLRRLQQEVLEAA